jgi:biopolymer transport protein ExbB/TolQ
MPEMAGHDFLRRVREISTASRVMMSGDADLAALIEGVNGSARLTQLSARITGGIDKLPKNSLFRTVAESGVRASQGGSTLVGQNDWIAMALTRQLEDANARLQGGIAFLASVGSTAPFVGLFGTVWGIMNSFRNIGAKGAANLATVAPGIAEALVTTAMGLFAAIPAVYFYNDLTGRVKSFVSAMEDFSMEFLGISERNFT